MTAFADDWEDVPASAPTQSAAATPSEKQQTAQADDWEDVPQWRGYVPVAASGVAQGAVGAVGSAISGTAELPADYNRRTLSALDRIDRGEKVPATEDPIGYQDMDPEMRKTVRADVERGAATYKPQETPVYKAGEAVSKFGQRLAPMSPEDKGTVTGRAALGVGSMAPALVAGMALGPEAGMIVGAGQFGLSSAHEEAEAARAKGANPDDVAAAARAGFAVNAAGGLLPLHTVLKPVERAAPGIVDWARARLTHAIQSGAVFATIGEAQEWLGQQIAQNFYDPNAGYSFDIRRVLGNLLGGSFLGALTPTPYRGDTSARAGRPAAETTEGKTHTEALADILGPEAAPAAPGPTPEDISILGGPRTAGERESLQEMLSRGAPVDELAAHPLVQAALEQNRAAVPTGTPEDFANPEWRAARVYNIDGDEVRGWDNAVGALTKQAEGYSPFGPVQNDRRAIIVLGPPASGKSAISEPLARTYRAAIVDPDDAKKIIPEYRGGLGTQAAHEESSFLAKDVLAGLVARGANVVLPRVGGNAEATRAYVMALKEAGYTVDLAHVAATPEISGRRNIARFLRTGRLVDPKYLEEVGDKPRQTAYMLRGEADDFADADTSQTGKYEVREGAGALADVLRNGRYGRPGYSGRDQAGVRETGNEPLIGKPVQGLAPHRVTAADGTAVNAAPIVVEADKLRTSQDIGYDPTLQPRQRERAASQAQVRDIAGNLDPERLGYSAEADRGAPIVGPDGMVESGNGRILALRRVYEQGGPAAQAYRDWLTRQGVDVSAYRHPVIVRQRQSPMTPEQRRAFTVAANQAATLAMSAPERAMSDAGHINAGMLGLIREPSDLAAPANRPFFRAFVAALPQSEQGLMADARGALSAEGLARVRNAVLAKAYGDAGILSRIAESTNDEVKSISNALTAAAPQWARFRGEVEAGRVRPDMDATPELLEAVSRTADIRGRGDKLDEYLAQRDAFDRLPDLTEGFMRIFYDPKGRRPASSQRISDAIRFYADEAGKVNAEKGLDLELTPVEPRDIQRLAVEREWEDVEPISDRSGAGDGQGGEAGSGEARGPWLGEGRKIVGPRGERLFSEEDAAAQQPTLDQLRERGIAVEKVPLAGGKRGEQYVIPGAEKISAAELLRRRAAEPMRGRVPQEIPGGLFGDLLGQEDIFLSKRNTPQEVSRDLGQRRPDEAPGELVEPAAGRAATPGVGGAPEGLAHPQADEGGQGQGPRGEAAGLTAPGTVPNNATRETGRGADGQEVRRGTQAVPGRAQPRRPTRAIRPDQLSLFGGPSGGGEVRAPDDVTQQQQGSAGAAAPAEGAGVTKPPARSRRDDTGRVAPPATAGLREAEQKIAERSRSNYRITPEDQIGLGGPKQKVRQNIDAIRILKQIEEEGRDATPGEKAVLVKYVGWGAFAQNMFAAGRRTGWEGERDAFRALVNDDEFDAAKASTLNAHFTSPDVIRGMWGALSHLGFEGGSAIEPAAGVGHFIGLIPDKVAPRTAWTAVELDPLSARITKALYGGAEVNAHGFEELKRPSNYYDLAISNVPFGDYHLTEKPYGSFPIHDFFFVKSLDKVRPGGVVAFITSRYTMDRQDAGTRRLLSKSADLVGAIRLPGGDKGAFAGNAGTEVTTDVLFLRKKIPGDTFPGADWENLKTIQTPEGPVEINEYFADRPRMMLGEMRKQSSMYRADEPVLIGAADGLQDKIATAARNMTAGALTPRATPKPETISAADIQPGVKDGSFFTKGDRLYQRIAGEGVEQKLAADQQDRVTSLGGMRDIYNDLLAAQLAGNTEKSEKLRAALRDEYDDFVKKYGPINKEERTVTSRLNKAGEPVVIVRHPNMARFMDDPDAWKVASIENYDPETGKASRAAVQTKDVIGLPVERQINGPSDALAASLNDTGRVDLDHIADALNLDTHDEVVSRLGDLIYNNPDGRQWQTTDEYLSGDVAKKLDEAREIAKSDPTYLRNVSALEKVQPEPLSAADITAQFGAPWVPADVYRDFFREALGARRAEVRRIPVTGEWKVDMGSSSTDAVAKYGTPRVSVEDVAEAALNNRQITVRDWQSDGSYVTNEAATTEARNKAEALKEAFTGDQERGIDGWVWSEPDRSQRLEAIYNRTYNNLANRKFDGSHLTLPGLNPDFATRQHRKDAVWRIVQNGNTLLAHVVGSGKTVSMIASGMEQKRLGLINKPAYVIPNHMLEQFSREFIQAYPDAKILVASKDQTTRENRKAFLAKVASNDWDGVVITHDAFGRINMAREFRRNFLQEQVDELERVMQAEAQEDAKSSTVKQLEKAKKKLQDRIQKLMNEERKDAGTSFEESGIDFLYVDEAHLFKNLQFVTRLGRVKGLSQGDSQRAEDLYLKMRYLEQNRPGRSGVFATGTPVSNTMAELWTMQRYLQLDKLKERGLEHFDSWANTFGKVVNNMELSADGRTFKEVSSFSRFVNVPELISLYAEIADTKTAAMLKLPSPDVVARSGKPGIDIVEAEPSEQEEAHIQKLVKLAEELKGKRPEKGQPNMLSVVTAGRKVATDGRLISGDFDFNPQGKIALAVDNIHRIWEQGNQDPAAPNKVQMVFLDLGVPQPKGGRKPVDLKPIELEDGSWGVEGEGATGGTFASQEDAEEYVKRQQDAASRIDLYADLKQRLAERGIPAKEIAAIHDATDDAKKARLFQRVRSGDVRVLLGSTGKMGVGTNVQDQLIAMHHLDAPWKPAEVEQRDGRIVRQGNQNDKVGIYRYVTKRSFDAFMWQKLDTKSKFIGQVLSGARGSRTAEDIDNPLPEAAEMKAAASGDPRILEHAELDRQVRALSSQRRTFEQTKARATYESGAAKERIKQYETALPTARADADMVNDVAGDKFSIELGDRGIMYERKAAGEAILKGLLGLDPRGYYSPKSIDVGRLSGFDMKINAQTHWDGTNAVLKAVPELNGRSTYSAANSIVINEHTDPAGLVRRFENILGSIKQNPTRLDGELKTERDNLDRLQKTLSQDWPKEKEYRDALKKLSDLTTSMQALKHPDVAQTERAQALAEHERNELRNYAQSVVSSGDLVKSVHLIGSQARFKPDANDVDVLYDIGKHDLPKDGDEASETVARMLEDSGVPFDFDRFDTFVKSGDRHFHLSSGAGRAFVENTHYAKEHASDPSIKLADVADRGRAPEGWETAGARDLGPKPGERAIRLGPRTVAHISDKYTAAEQKIAEAVQAIGERMAPQAQVRGAKALRMEGSPIWGAFVDSERFPQLIAWSLEKAGEVEGRGVKPIDVVANTVRHEIIHHLRAAGLIRPEEWKALEDTAKKEDWAGKYGIEGRYPRAADELKTEEAIAERFADWRADKATIKAGTDPIQRLIRGAFDRMDLFMRRVAAAARQFLGKDATANDVFTRIETGEVGRRQSEYIEAQKQYFSDREAAQTPGQEARERRQAAAYPHSVWGEVTQASDKLRASTAALAKSVGIDQIVRDMQIRWTPMAARDATPESRAIVKKYMIDRRQAREAWNKADKYLVDHFTPEQRKRMWDAADEESVAIQQGRPTQGIGLDRLSPAERSVVELMQRRSQGNFDTAKMLGMVQGEGLPSYVPRMLVRMAEGKFEPGIGPGSEVVRDIRTLALTNAKLEDAISAKQLVNTIAEIGERSGNPTVNEGSIPTRGVGAEGLVSHAIDVEMGKGFSDTTPNLKRRKYLTREETEAAANRAPAPDPDAPKWFTLSNAAFQVWRPKMVDPETDFYRSEVKRMSGMTVPKRLVPAIDQHGETVWEKVPIYVRADFEGPLKAALKQDWGGAAQRALMSLKSKAMSVIMFSPLIHNQVEWGRALPAAPGKVLTFQTYLEGNRIANDLQQMREAISGGLVPIGGHGFMQDAMSIAEAPSIAPGHSLTAKGLGYGTQALGHLTRAYDPRAKADEVRRAIDWFGSFWHNTMLWDRVRDLQLGLWSHVKDAMIAKGYDPYSANVAASHFANRYAGALPVEAMSGLARGIANVLMFSRSFTMGNLGAYKDAISGLPRDAQAMIQHNLGWDELQKVQSYVKRKSRAMLAIDAGLYYATLSALQSAFHTAGTVPTMATLGGMMAGNAAGMKAGRWGQLGLAAAGGAAGFGLASVLGASPGTRSLEEELGAYWNRFTDLLQRTYEHPGEVLANPFKNLTKLSSTSENEPGKEGRLLVGYDEDGTALYMRLPAGKVTEELIGYLTEPNDMFHRKLSTFAKPVDQILENNVGFGRKLYDPNADTPVSISHNIAKIAAQLVLAQLPGGAVMSAYLWARGGPGSSTEGLKTTGQATGFTFSKGYPGGPELGVLNDARERYEYRKQEAMAGIRDQIRQGDIAGAQQKMSDLGIPPGLQDFYIKTTTNPQARLTKRQMKDFMQYASPEEQQRFFKAQEAHASVEEGHASGGVVKRASGGRILQKGLTAEYALGVDKPWSIYDASGALRANGKTREEAIEALTPQRAAGGRVERRNIDHAPTEAQKSANNYAKDHLHWNGLPLTIENARGSYRGGVDRNGKAWSVCMPCHYGYVKRTEGADGDHVDVFLGPHKRAPHIFIVDQVDAETGRFDEHKSLLGFGSRTQALSFYRKVFSDGRGKDRIGHVTTMSVAEFKDWLKNYDTTKPLAPKLDNRSRSN